MIDRADPAGAGRPRRHWRLSREVRFTDSLPPPLTGYVGGLRVALHIWPGDAIPSHGEAFKPSSGPLAGWWVLVRFPGDS